jgi:hypothetical protein
MLLWVYIHTGLRDSGVEHQATELHVW